MDSRSAMFVLLSALLSMISLTEVFAQTDRKIIISLSYKGNLDSSIINEFYINTVVVSISDTGSIGLVNRSKLLLYTNGQNYARAYLKGGIKKSIGDFLKERFSKKMHSQKAVNVNIKKISYSENYAFGIRMNLLLSFSTADSSGAIKEFYTAHLNDVSELNRGEVIGYNLIRSIINMSEYLKSPLSVPNFIDDDELTRSRIAKILGMKAAIYSDTITSEDKILSCKNIRPGIYTTPKELISNRPGVVGSLEVDYKKEGRYAKVKVKNEKINTKTFGMSDGKNIFINTGLYKGDNDTYVLVENVGRYLLWCDDFPTLTELRYNELPGSALGLIVKTTNMLIPNGDCLALDSETGRVFNVTDSVLKKNLAEYPNLLIEYNKLDYKNYRTNYEFMLRYNQLKLE
jgi:hypothetical protein